MSDNKTTEEALVSLIKNNQKTRLETAKKRGQVTPVSALKAQNFLLLHIEELTFEEDSPRKEALENVIGSLGIEGVNFVYLLLGDANGVSFYFGIVKDQNFKGELELDVDDIGRYLLKSSLEGNFRGSKITEQNGYLETDSQQSILQKIQNMTRFAKVEGVPSINEDSEDFQGVDRLVDVMMGDEFALMVLADPMSANEVHKIQETLYGIYNKLSPLAKRSVQESNGETTTEGKNKGRSWSKTEGVSDGSSVAHTSGTSRGTSESKGGGSGSGTTNFNNGTNKGANNGKTDTTNTGTSSSDVKGESDGVSHSVTINKGHNISQEFSDKEVAEWVEYIDEVLLKRVEYGKNKSLFDVGVYLAANEKGTLLKLGNTIRSLFSGKEDNKAPMALFDVKNQQEIIAIKNLQLPVTQLEAKGNLEEACLLFSQKSNKLGNWMSTSELSIIAGLPQKEVVGLGLKEEVEFGLNIKKIPHNKKSDRFLLGNLVRSGLMLDGVEITLDKKELNKHTFITGVTGSGKTTTCHRILRAADIPYMVIEPAKSEYRVLTSQDKELLVFTLGNENIAPFRINPFEFFDGENISSRVDMIKANIEAAFDMEAAIPQIIEAALYKCYENYGWDIASSTNSHFDDPFADGVYSFPTLSDLISQTEVVVKEQGFDERLQKDYTGSIKARLQGLIQGAKGFMLDTPRSINFLKLIEQKVVLELEDIKNGAEKSLVMGFVLINLNEAIKQKHNEYQVKGKKFKHITLIEEAHRLLSKAVPGDNPSKKLGVETFADMLAEVRKYGESLIIVDQIPDKLTPEVLKNTSTKIVHKLFANDDKQAIGNTMALDDEQKTFLSNLEVGRAIVSSQDFAKPIQVQVRQLEDISTTESALVEETVIRDLCLTFYQQDYAMGVIKGLHLFDKQPSLAQMECYLSIEMRQLIKGWADICGVESYEKTTVPKVFDIKSHLAGCSKKGNGLLKNLGVDLDFMVQVIMLHHYQQCDLESRGLIEDMLQQVIEGLVLGDETVIEGHNWKYLKSKKGV